MTTIPCAQFFHDVLRHVDALFYQADGARIPQWEQDKGFTLRCWNNCTAVLMAVQVAVEANDLDATKAACRAWYRAMRTQRETLEPHETLVSGTAQET